jgi:two-component system chemotaxis sensor kinase CheA
MKNSDVDAGFISEALPAFLSEAHEQIESMEQLLLQIEGAPKSTELLNALFRCAHTVKGTAGIFGLDAVVEFTHHVETQLDRLREGQLDFTPELGTLLLKCNDQIRLLVDAIKNPEINTPEDLAARATLIGQLQALGAVPAAALVAPERTETAATSDQCERLWNILVQFGPECFRNGTDPLAVLTYVQAMGNVPNVVCDIDAIPTLEALDAESCYLSLDLRLDTRGSRQEIESAFSFVRDDCQLSLIEPGASADHFIKLIAQMPESPRLGDILVAVGAVTPMQLGAALRDQGASAHEGKAPPLGQVLQKTSGLEREVIDAALIKQKRQREQRDTSSSASVVDDSRMLRVHADRLDAVINLLGELVIAGAGAALLARQVKNSALIEANAQVGRLIEEIRNGTLHLRMVPIGDTFARFRRVVRDTAAKLGKEVDLEIVGGDTELDKSMVERIADPLMHLVRNGLDHGLETPAVRQAAGKPRQGKLTLMAAHESGAILIRIIDDGQGVRRQRVLERAWERGLIERGVTPPDDQLLALLFAPGFSTAECVTDLSGRGVGMDVVRRNIESLRGSVVLSSVEGEGSTIEIRLPLTLAIIDGFLVAVGTSRFIFPLETVVEVIESRMPPTGSDHRARTCVELRGRLLPVLDLRELYGLDSAPPERVSVVVIQSGGRQYGVVVDALLGQHQTVIKPMGRMFRSLRGISGSSILGNGEVALIIDVNALGKLAATETTGHDLPEPNRRASHAHSPH